MNVADSEVVASVMLMAGYETCDNLDVADAVFLNTCSVRDNAEQKIYNRLDTLNAERKKGHKLIIGVLGCSPSAPPSLRKNLQPYDRP